MRNQLQPVLFIAGGGTGGHIQPALAIAEAFSARRPEVDIRFCGTANGMESKLVPATGHPFHTIRARGFPRVPSREMMRAFADLFAGRKACAALIRQYQPFAVVGTGGYVCGPLVAAARSAGLPVVLHEQNAFPGRANRMLSRGARLVCVSYEGTARYFPRAREVILTGNPVRNVFFHTDRMEARRALGLPQESRMVLMLGGSQGAASLNSAVLGWVSAGLAEDVRVVMAVGERNWAQVRSQAKGIPGLETHAYLENIHQYMAAADVVISRAGALTCAEIAAIGCPSVLIPYPYAAGDHQTVNAQVFEQTGAAIRIADQDFSADKCSRVLSLLLADPRRRERMGKAARTLARPAAAAQIAQALENIFRESGHGKA